MKTSPKYQPVALVITSLSELCKALVESKRKCEEIARKISNEQLRKTIINLEQLNIQYANELNSQIQSLGGEFNNPDMISHSQNITDSDETKINIKKETLN